MLRLPRSCNSSTAVVVATHNNSLVQRFSHPVLTLADNMLHAGGAPAKGAGANSRREK